MNDAAFEAQKIRIRKLMAKWKDPLGLHNWAIEQSYHRGTIPPGPNGQTYEQTLACTSVRWQYLYAHIEWNCEKAAESDDAWLENAVIHEYCHVLVAEMRHEDLDILHEERVCSMLTLAVQWSRQLGQNEVKKTQERQARRSRPKPANRVGVFPLEEMVNTAGGL